MGLSKSQYDAIMREYDRKRMNAANRLDKRFAQVYESIPEYYDVEEQIRETAYQCGLKGISGDTDAFNKMHEEIERLANERDELLIKNGFDIDYLKPDYECKDCSDTGYIDGRKCHCLKQKILKQLYSKSNVGDVLERENFNTLNVDEYSDMEYEKMKPVIEKCKAFAKEFDNSDENLMLMGNPGVGKTFLSNCIAKELLDSGHSVIYFTSVQLFDTLSKYAFTYENSYEGEGILEDIYSCDLLIIDDLGTEIATKLVESQLFNIINERIIRNKATMISSNLCLSDMNDRYSERIVSRVAGNYSILKLDISDIRFRKKISSQGK